MPPKINNSIRVERHSVVLGNSLTLTCDASGNPPPNLRWVREGHALTFISNPNLQLLDKNRQLQIVDAQLIDLGSYTCEASNVAGNVTKEYSVSVLGRYIHIYLKWFLYIFGISSSETVLDKASFTRNYIG